MEAELTKKGIEEMSVKQLKDCCKQRGLKVSGTKDQLKQRLFGRLTTEEKKNDLKRKEDQLVARTEKRLKMEVATGKKFVEVTDYPVEFTAKSGKMLWGQVQCILSARKNPDQFDSLNGHTRDQLQGGTVRMRPAVYQFAAKQGQWRVFPIYYRGNGDEYLCAFIACHETADVSKLVARVAAVGINYATPPPDPQIVYINRYDWSWHSAEENEIRDALTELKIEFDDTKGRYGEYEIDSLSGGRCCFVDAEDSVDFLFVVSAVSPNKLKGRVYRHGNSSVMITGPPDSIEYELGWIIYSGEKHASFPTEDEVIGFVYDHTYCGFDSEGGGSYSVDLGG